MVMVYDNEYIMLLVMLYSLKLWLVWCYVYNVMKSYDFLLYYYECRKILVYSYKNLKLDNF